MAKTTVAVRFTGDVAHLLGALGDADSKLGALGKAAGAAFLAVGTAAVGSIAGLAKLGGSFDEQFDKIRVGTGQTGETLDALEGSFKNVLKTVPASFDDAGTAVSDLNVRLGLTGKPLEDLSGQFINLSRITETDLATNVDNLTRVFGDWGVVAEDQSKTLDKVYRAAQASGIGIEDLSTAVVQFGAPLRNLGFGLDDSLALLAQFNKTGVNTETVFAGLKAGVGKLAKAGEDVPTTFKRIVAEIEKLGPGSEATGKAIELFGQRAGPDLADAITGGKFKVDGLLASITGGKDTINGAAKDTADFSEQWRLFKNRILVGLEPLATGVFNAIGKAMDALGPVMDTVQGGLRAMFAAFKAGDGDVTSSGFAGTMERIGNTARAVVEWFKANWPQIRKTISEVFDWVMSNVVPVVIDIAKQITAAIAGIVRWVKENWPQISEAIGHVVNVVMDIFNALADFMRPLWDNIKGIIEAAIRVIQGVIQTVLAIINGDWGRAWEGLKAVVSGVWDGIRNVVGGAIDVLKSIIGAQLGAIAGIWNAAWDGLKSIPQTVLRTVVDAFLAAAEWITRGAASAFGWVPGLGGKLKAAAREVEAFRDDVNRSLSGIKDKTFNVRAIYQGPTILGATPAFRAAGGPVTRGMPYIVGENRPELFVPDSNGTILPSVPTASAPAAAAPAGGQATTTTTTAVTNNYFTVNVAVAGSVVSEQELGEIAIGQVRTYIQRNGSL